MLAREETNRLKLNTDQREALEQMKRFISQVDSGDGDSQSNYPFFALEGGAGTGKTFTIKYLINWYKDVYWKQRKEGRKPKIYCGAFTHQAVRVIGKMRDEGVRGVEFLTLHRLLALSSAFDGEAEKQVTYATRKAPPIDDADLVIIDERSMVDTTIWNHLIRKVKGKRLPVILMGDIAQLPPVKEVISPSYRMDIPTAYLTEVMRTELDNPVMDIISKARILTDINHPDYDNAVYELQYIESRFNLSKTKGVFLIRDKDGLNKILRQSFCSDSFQSDPSFCRVLAFTNDRVNEMNTQIRQFIHGKQSVLSPFIEGERLRATSSIFDTWGQDIIIDNSTMMEVIEVQHKEKPFPHWLLSVRDDTNQVHKFNTLCFNKTGQETYEHEYQEIRNRCLRLKASGAKYPWRELNEFRNTWNNKVGYLYAMTTHLAQGSSLNNVIVIMNDLLIARKSDPVFFGKLLYTAFSRIRNRLFVVR